MTSIDDLFERTRAENRAALVGYLPAGFPTKETSIAAIRAMIDGGVDLVEVGLPYSDPVMDGPTIQAAAEIALAAGSRTADVFDVVAASAATGTPTVVMTYWNLVERYGVDRFADELAAAGGAGMITPDLIPDEGAEWDAASRAHGLDRVYLVAPSSTDARLAMTAEAASGFIYATAVMGVTGQRQQTSSLAPALVARLREVTDKPVGVGLGVSNGAQAREIAAYADAVIVGSAIVRCLLDAPDEASGIAAVRELAADLRDGVERA
ncbi:tryptophan synthase, alpha subunit [Aeromicrobium marinum DSM 15272]|uniref:Tryptophan synthase alpha chain n=1 Tax=Aeromicrobium marinum DSM 15272 TaxID=585531 RepID=E2S925_9ACTN|nr:tryptophan synthase subunit alpha [Aeromicrobium marinum]EFQ84295.1 tryptophan synthase, alpha subunit [Aeromicrobium marinum DSM 15272]